MAEDRIQKRYSSLYWYVIVGLTDVGKIKADGK